MAGGADTYEAYGVGWATVSNTPFRMFKHYVHEGGISTPLIAHWPGGIAKPGQKVATPGHLIDLMATAIDVSGTKYPEQKNGVNIKPMEGKSLKPLFAGRNIERDALYWEHEGNRAIREGNFKLVSEYGKSWELYDISKDRSEQSDLAASMPDLAKRLDEKWQAYADRAEVQPWEAVTKPAPKKNKKAK